jgi:alpha-tubulin suppressor-like RCC1 family protein
LGLGNQNNQSSPKKINFFSNPEEIISLSCGKSFSICFDKKGIFSWGENNFGQLGLGHQKNQSSPQKILFFENPEEVISISCGAHFCVCLCKNGVFSWGENRTGQLGLDSLIDEYFSPQRIFAAINSEEFISICCGYDFCISICKNGVFSWGNNNCGQLGIGNQLNFHGPFPIFSLRFYEEIISLFCGIDFCVCICKNGILKWGNNEKEQLGIIQKIEKQLSPLLEKSTINDTLYLNDLSFPPFSINRRIYTRNMLILAREYDNTKECLIGKDYLPDDMFKLIMDQL